MKNRKKLVITLIGVIVLGIGLFVYQTFIKKQLHFKENMTVEINGKFNPLNTGFCVSKLESLLYILYFYMYMSLHFFLAF